MKEYTIIDGKQYRVRGCHSCGRPYPETRKGRLYCDHWECQNKRAAMRMKKMRDKPIAEQERELQA